MSDKMNRFSGECRLSLIVIFAFLLSLTLGQSAFALNGGSGNKIVSYNGYRYINEYQIQVWLDKNVGIGPFDPLQFKIFEGTDTFSTEITVSSVDTGSGKNISVITGMPNGGSYLITSAEPFEAGRVYTVVLNNTLTTNNGTNLGHYYFRKDIEFSFTTPDTPGTPNVNGTYASVAPKIDFRPEQNATKVPHEIMIWFSLNVPMDNATASAFSDYADNSSTLVLKRNGTPVIYDYSINNVQDGDIYAPIVTDDRTAVIFPMSGGGAAFSYNLDGDAKYTLEIPQIALVNGTVIPAQKLNFTTATDIVPTKFTEPPSITTSGQDFIITWPACIEKLDASGNLLSPAAEGYNVWSSTDPYWDFVKLNDDPVPATETSYTTSGLTPATNYYFRVTAVNSSAETGFSDYVQATTPSANTDPNADFTLPNWPDQSALTITGITHTGLTLTWPVATDNVGVTAYKIYKDGTVIDTINGGATTTYNVTGLSAGTQYAFQVQAGDVAGSWSTNGPASEAITVSTSGIADTQAPSWPNKTFKTAIKNADQVTLAWYAATDNVGVTGYKIYYGGEQLGSVNGNTTTFTCPTPPGTGQSGLPFTVQAGDAAGNWSTDGPSATIGGTSQPGTNQTGNNQSKGVFNDIAGHWAKSSIEKLSSLGAVGGYPDGSFKPGKTTTRAEFATMLVKSFKLTGSSSNKFTDTAKHWAKDAIATAVACGIVNGYNQNTFGPNDLITREQMAAMIINAAKLAPATGEIQFADSGKVSAWAQIAVNTAVMNGIMNGYPGNYFQPRGNATRAEAVTVIVNALK